MVRWLWLAVFLLGGAVASAQEREYDETSTLPINPFADAKAGDWSTFVVRATDSSNGENKRFIVTYRVTAVSGDQVSLCLETLEPEGRRTLKDHGNNPFSRKEAPTVNQFFADDIQEVTERSDDKVTVEEQAFDCKKLRFRSFVGAAWSRRP